MRFGFRCCWLVGSLLALSAGGLASRSAADAPPTYALHWVRGEGAEQCASGPQLERALEQLLGPALRPASEASLTIEGSVTRARAERWGVRVRVLDGVGAVLGERTLERSGPCSALTETIVLILALTIAPERAANLSPAAQPALEPERALLEELTQHPPVPTPVPARELPRAQDRAGASPPALRQTRRPAPHAPGHTQPKPPTAAAAPPWTLALTLGAAVDALLLPRVAAGASLGVDVSIPRTLLLAVQAFYWAPVPVEVTSSDADKQVRFSAAHVQLGLCWPLLRHASLQLGPCLGGVVGLRWVDASELHQSHHAKRAYAGPLAALGLQYTFLERWFAGLDVTGALVWPRDQFTYQDELDRTVALFRPGWGSVWGALKFGVRL